jgi:LPPG:FO 2-phospho-L-lactate transferase
MAGGQGPTARRVTLLAGGFGGSKLAHGFALAAAHAEALDLSIVVNTADDAEIHGLHVAPDLDTVMYTLAGLANEETGWGVRDETWSASEMLERYGAETWFRIGDRDLATNVRRTERLGEGATLTEVTAELAASLGVTAALLPMSDDPVRTEIRTDEGWLEFQEYFVHRRHADEVRELRQTGLADARPSQRVLAALRTAELVVIAPSNPFLSVGPILSLPGLRDASGRLPTDAPVVAVSPIVGGAALRGPADRIIVSLGGEASALGIARHYMERYPALLDALVIDEVDAVQAPAIEALGPVVHVTDTIMRDQPGRERLAREVLGFGLSRLRP